jgi:S-methylmethionine-dependent homocysteine/selenocysteine methylase
VAREPDWGEVLGYSSEELAQANRDAVALVEDIRHENPDVPTVLAGVVGPRGDGYRPDRLMTADEAARYHTPQIATLGGNGVDLIGGITLTYAAEAVGIARGARAAGVPSVISFTVETDGRLPDGQPLRDAVEQVDVETERAPLYFMVNCAHPTHFANVLEEDGEWLGRIRGVRANASTRSHAELDEAEDLDDGDPVQFGEEYRELDERLPDLLVVGGCCGTDERHIGEICRALG